MKSQRLPISIDEYHAMPRELGWKYEYWNDHAHISPQHTAVVTCTVSVEPRAVNAPCKIRPATTADIPLMQPAYVSSFEDTIDYCDCSLSRIEAAAKENLRTHFEGKRGVPFIGSQVALAPTSQKDAGKDEAQVIGAALIVEQPSKDDEPQPMLDLLFVVPMWHRRGVATALVAAAVNALHEAGHKTLKSRFMLGNPESRKWHYGFGFQDDVDIYVVRHYYRHAQHELERREQMGDLTAGEHERLTTQRDDWKRQLEKVQAMADEFGLASVVPYA